MPVVQGPWPYPSMWFLESDDLEKCETLELSSQRTWTNSASMTVTSPDAFLRAETRSPQGLCAFPRFSQLSGAHSFFCLPLSNPATASQHSFLLNNNNHNNDFMQGISSFLTLLRTIFWEEKSFVTAAGLRIIDPASAFYGKKILSQDGVREPQFAPSIFPHQFPHIPLTHLLIN